MPFSIILFCVIQFSVKKWFAKNHLQHLYGGKGLALRFTSSSIYIQKQVK